MPSVPDQLPPPTRRFVNRRAELAELDRLTRVPHDGTVPVVVIRGMSGVGKTATSRYWAHVNRDRFADGRLYADFGRGGVSSRDVLAGFLQALGVPLHAIPVTLAECTTLFRSCTVGKRLLLLLDDVEHAAQVTPLIPASAPGSVVLVTSRMSLEELQAGGAGCVDMGPFEKASSRELLTLLIGERRARAEPRAVEELVDIAAGLPIALVISGARLAVDQRSPVGRFVGALHADEQERIDVGAPGSIDLVFSSAYRSLSPSAALLYRRLAAHPGPSFTSVVAEAAAGWPVEPIGDLLYELYGSFLIEQRGSWSRFYDPLLLHARGALALDESAAEEASAAGRIVGYYTDTVEWMGHWIDPASRLPMAGIESRGRQALYSSAEAFSWLEAERVNLTAVLGTATEHRWDAQVSRIAMALWPAYRRRGSYVEALEIFELGMRAAQRSGDASVEARMRLHLALMYLERDDPERAGPELEIVAAMIEQLRQGDVRLLEPTVEFVMAPDFHRDEGLGVMGLPNASSYDVVSYQASGGASALLQVRGGATLRVEAHQASFALVWPTHRSLSALADIITRPADARPGAGTEVLVVAAEGAIHEGAFADLRARIRADDDVEFARLDLADVVVTWQQRADPTLTGADETAHEIGLGAERFDPQLLRDLIEQTAVATIASAAGELVEEARAVLVAVPVGSLRRDEATEIELDA